MSGNELIFFVIFILVGHVIVGIYFAYRVLSKTKGPSLPDDQEKHQPNKSE
jgi:hypothetical protein